MSFSSLNRNPEFIAHRTQKMLARDPEYYSKLGKKGGSKRMQLHPNDRSMFAARIGREFFHPESLIISKILWGEAHKRVKNHFDITAWTRQNPNHQSEAGKIGGPIGGRIGGKITGPRNVESGQIFLAQKGSFVWHFRHFHRSIEELNHCNTLRSLYPKSMFHSNVRLFKKGIGGVEIDFVIAINPKDPSTWIRVIEYHQVRSWEGETSNSYKSKRLNKFRSLGVTCKIEMILSC